MIQVLGPRWEVWGKEVSQSRASNLEMTHLFLASFDYSGRKAVCYVVSIRFISGEIRVVLFTHLVLWERLTSYAASPFCKPRALCT